MTAQCRPLPACRPPPLQLSPCGPSASSEFRKRQPLTASTCHHRCPRLAIIFSHFFSAPPTPILPCPGNICAPGGPLCVCSRALHSKASHNCVPDPAACCLCARIPPHIQPPKNSASPGGPLHHTPQSFEHIQLELGSFTNFASLSGTPPHALLHAHSIPHSSSKIVCQPRPRRHLFMHKQHSIFKLHPQFPVLS